MTNNITTLALNLLIAERASHRKVFANKIEELVQPTYDASGKEKLLKNNFMSILAACVENPNSEYRDLFYQIAQHYNQVINQVETAAA